MQRLKTAALLIFILTGSLLAVAYLFQSTTFSQEGGPPPAKLGTIERNIEFCRGGDESLLMDVYYPATAGGPLPVAIYVHGGGWSSGDKGGGAGLTDLPEMRARGYLVVSVNYRLAPQNLFPAMIEDVKCAVRHLRANAAAYGLNPDKIGVWGTSAGGHLVALLGTSDQDSGFEGTGGFAGVSSRVQAVVDMFGPIDLPLMFSGSQGQTFRRVFGASGPEDPILELASPTHWVSRDDPPVLMLHGNRDALVPLEQSQIFLEALLNAGVEAELVVVVNGGHGFTPTGGPIRPSRAEITKIMADFFDEHLK